MSRTMTPQGQKPDSGSQDGRLRNLTKSQRSGQKKNIISCLGFPAYSNIPRIIGACGNMAMTVFLGFINQKSISRSEKTDRHVEATHSNAF